MTLVALVDRARDMQRALADERRETYRSVSVPFVPKPPKRGWLDLEEEIAAEFAELSSHIDRSVIGLRIVRDDGTRRATYYRENRTAALAYAKAYAAAHRPEINERKREARAADPELHRLKDRARIERHREKLGEDAWLGRRRAYYAAHADRILALQKAAYDAGEGAERRAARAKEAQGKHCGWAPCGTPIVPPARGVVPDFCSRACRTAANNAAGRCGSCGGSLGASKSTRCQNCRARDAQKAKKRRRARSGTTS